jgi:hypothetical protein
MEIRYGKFIFHGTRNNVDLICFKCNSAWRFAEYVLEFDEGLG